MKSLFCLALMLTLLLSSVATIAAAPPPALSESKHWTISQGMSSHTVTDLLQDQHGFLWIATRNGLQRFDGVLFEQFSAGRQEHQLPSNHILDIWFNDNLLWVATSRGVAYYDYQQQRFYRHPTLNEATLSSAAVSASPTKMVGNLNQRLLLLRNNQLWQATTTTAKFVPLTYNSKPLTAISNIQQAGDWIWISAADGHIYVWDGQGHDVFKLTQANPITATLPAVGFNHILNRHQLTWIAHDNGVLVLDENLRIKQQLNNITDLNTTATIKRLAYIDKAHLLLGTNNGISILETPAQQTAFLSDHHDLDLPPFVTVNAFTVDHLKRLWIGTENSGLYQFTESFSGLHFAQLIDFNLTNELVNQSLPEMLSDYTAAVKGYDGFLWLTTTFGLIKYDPQLQQMVAVYNFPNDRDHHVKQLQLFAEHLFLVDEQYGLMIFDLVTSRWRQPFPDNRFLQQANLRLALQPGKIWVADKFNAVAINEFLVASKPVPLTQGGSENELKPLVVTTEPEQNTLLLDFVTPLAQQPEQVHYRYRLLDLMDHWQYTTRPLQPIAINRLPAQRYELQVQASANGIHWAPSYQQPLIINGPWWQSSWAIGSYLLVAVTLLILFVTIFINAIKQRKQLQLGYDNLVHAIHYSGAQLWDWHPPTEQLIRTNINPEEDIFPLDGVRNGQRSEIHNVHPQDIKRLRDTLSALTTGSADSMTCGYRLKHAGQWLWVVDRGRVTEWNSDTQPSRIQGALINVTEIMNTEERLTMLALSLNNISDGICIFDRFFRKREVNKAYTKITGFARDDVINQPFSLPLHDESFVNQIKRAVIKDGHWRGEVTDQCADGSELKLELTLDSVCSEDAEIELVVANFSDITERLKTESELRRLSNTDSLTGLPNRSYFQVSHSNLVRKKIPHALLVFDLDNFKKINDSLGHMVGDELLCRVAERLTDIGRRQDTLYRLGGDEFGFLVEDTTDVNAVSLLASQINSEVALPYTVQQHEVVVSSSIGIVLYPHDGHTSQALLQQADTAMYHAKQRGGNCYQFFSQSMNENAIRRLQTEQQLRLAIREQRIEVYYQPKVELASQHIAGIEALVRIRKTDGSMMNPNDFIPLAEETGLIVPLSEQVLRRACQDMKRFLNYPGAPKHVAINLSARQFLSSSLAFHIESILADEKLHPRHIEFEITEGMVMSDPERAIIVLENLADMGVHLALDDFGTGYSSLAYLKRFPLHTLKIDKAFVDDITSDDKDRNMVASIVAMAHNLGLKVVAEGVEDKTQLAIIKTLRCEYVQGFYFAKPMSADDFIRYIEHHQTNAMV